jgi:hypothetical protein
MPDSRRFTNQTSAAQALYGDYEQKHGDGATPAPKQPAGARKASATRNASATLLTGWTQLQGDPAFDPHLRDQPGPAPGRGVVLRGEAPDWAGKIGADQPRLTESAPLATRSTMPDGVQTGVSHDPVSMLAHDVRGSGDPLVFSYEDINDVKPSDFKKFRDAIQRILPGKTSEIDVSDSHFHGYDIGEVSHNVHGTASRNASGAWSFEGEMSAKPNAYDFNVQPYGRRDKDPFLGVFYPREWATRLGGKLPGANYSVRYSGSKRVQESGE